MITVIATDIGDDQSMFVLTISEKIQVNVTKILSRKYNGLIKDGKL